MPDGFPIKFYYYPRACSLAVHIALEESGLAYERVLIDIKAGDNHCADYLAVNPKGSVPAIGIDGRYLTETHAILTYLGDRVPTLALMPPTGTLPRYQAHEWLNFLSSTMHTAIRSIFRPVVYAGEARAVIEAVRNQGLKNLASAVAVTERRLADGPWALGGHFSLCDAYLFVMYLWTLDERIERVPDRPRWAATAKLTWQRPAVQRVVAVERKIRPFPLPADWIRAA